MTLATAVWPILWKFEKILSKKLVKIDFGKNFELIKICFSGNFKLFKVIIASPFLPESFRWYLSKGKFEKGKKAVSNYAAHCDVEIPKESLERMVKPVWN